VTGVCSPPFAHAARDLAQLLLRPLPGRWRHTIGVARAAGEVAHLLDGEDPDVLIAAAWLHDIGYGPTIAETGFHPLDGARYLDRLRWPARIGALVAHHSGATYLASALGLGVAVDAYPREVTALSDALTYADQTTGPDGHRISLDDRLSEALARHGSSSAYAAARARREPHLRALVRRVEARLSRAGTAPE